MNAYKVALDTQLAEAKANCKHHSQNGNKDAYKKWKDRYDVLANVKALAMLAEATNNACATGVIK